MINLNENFVLIDAKDCPANLEYIDFDFKKKYSQINSALKINFSSDINYNTMCIKQLQYLENKNIKFCSKFGNYNVKYIISNYNQDIISGLKAISISNIKKKYEFLYDITFKSLDIIWSNSTPCKFCNNICTASRHNMTSHKENGCCYSFTYSKNIFKFIDNVNLCKYFDENKKNCTTQNISCKFFVCNYLRKKKIFNIKMKDFILVQSFFNKKQQLILKYNFFKSKEEILNKLLEENNEPLIIYYLRSKYRIN